MRWLVLIALLVGCKNADGESCSSYDDCDSGICGGGICIGGDCPCDDGWECVSQFSCGSILSSCAHVCRKICSESTECPGEQLCQTTQDEDNPRHCQYGPPRFYAQTEPYTVAREETITVTLTIEPFPDGWAMIRPSLVGGNVTFLSPPRVEGKTFSRQVIVHDTSSLVFETRLQEITSAADSDDQFDGYIMQLVPINVVP